MEIETAQQVLSRLEDAKEKAPGLAEVVDLQRDLLKAQMQVNVDLTAPQFSSDEVQTRFRHGKPLLRPQDITVDWDTFTHLYRQVCQIAARHRPDLSEQFELLLTLLDDDPDSLRASLVIYLDGGCLEVEGEKERGKVLAFVLYHSLRPFLLRYAHALAPVVQPERWRRGNCPVCGGEPDLAVLDEESGARRLICSRCDTEWTFPRVQCPFCNSREPSHLSYYPTEDPQYRLGVCQECKRYIKMIDLRKAHRRVLFPVERITTVALDLDAQEEGYH